VVEDSRAVLFPGGTSVSMAQEVLWNAEARSSSCS
jgi:hypothetical protein